MWCGRGIWHTERCIGDTPARYLQLWITPKRQLNSQPHYEIIDKGTEFGVIPVNFKQDITVKGGILTEEYTVTNAYLYVVEGSCTANGITLNKGDGCEIYESTVITPIENTHILTFEI